MEELDNIFEWDESTEENEFETEELADDNQSEAAEEAEDSNEEESTEKTVEETAAEKPETLLYKHNHATAELDKNSVSAIAAALGKSEPDIVAQLQKGEDYDRKIGQLQQFQQTYGGVVGRIEDISRTKSITIEEATKQFVDMAHHMEVYNFAQEIAQENPDMPPEAVRKIAEERADKLRAQAEASRNEGGIRAEQEFARIWERFFSRHPNLVNTELPDEVYRYFEDGYTPEEAYLKYQSEQQALKMQEYEKKMTDWEKAKKNKETSPGSLKATKSDEKTDPFLEGMMSAFD